METNDMNADIMKTNDMNADIDVFFSRVPPDFIRSHESGRLDIAKWLLDLAKINEINHVNFVCKLIDIQNHRRSTQIAKNRILKLQGKKSFFPKFHRNSKISREKNFVNASKCKKYYR